MSESKRVQHYNNPAELELDHPTLDRQALMPKSEFLDLPASYGYVPADWVKCQLVEQADGHTCKHAHGSGWVMLRKDGTKGYIGKDCADKHFEASEAFAKSVARARAHIRTDELLSRLRELLADPCRRDNLQTGIVRQRALKARIAGIRSSFPDPLKLRLNEMIKGGARAIPLFFENRERIEDKDGNERDVSKWIPRTVATLSSPGGINPLLVEDVAARLRIALTAYEVAIPSNDRKDRELQDWIKALDDIDRCVTEIAQLEVALGAFLEPDNLKWLCWLCARDTDQLESARAALSLSTNGNVSNRDAKRAMEEWRTQISAANDGRRFRVN